MVNFVKTFVHLRISQEIPLAIITIALLCTVIVGSIGYVEGAHEI